MPALPEKKSLPFVVCVEGNIGSGKSTLLSSLASAGYTVIPEPVLDIWGKYLPRLYEDINRWGFCFQMEVIDWFRQLQSKQFKVHLKKEIQQSMLSPTLLRNLRCTSPEIEQLKLEKRRRAMRMRNKKFNLSPRKRFKPNPNSNQSDAINSTTPAKAQLSKENENTTIETPKNDLKLENIDGRLPLTDITPVSKVRRTFRDVLDDEQKQTEFDHDSSDSDGTLAVSTRTMIIVERSALSAIEVFGRNLLANGNITDWEFSLLQRFYSIINWQPAFIVYLRCDASTCCERIRQRNRDGEDKVNYALINSLHQKHEELFIEPNEKQVFRNQTVITVDGAQDSVAVAQQALVEISKLERHLHSKHVSTTNSPTKLRKLNRITTDV